MFAERCNYKKCRVVDSTNVYFSIKRMISQYYDLLMMQAFLLVSAPTKRELSSGSAPLLAQNKKQPSGLSFCFGGAQLIRF